MTNPLKCRYNRATYWAMIALAVIFLGILHFIDQTPLRVHEVVLAFIAVPRLHDIGKSGWLVLAPIALAVAWTILTAFLLPVDYLVISIEVMSLIIAGLMIWLGCIPGERVANRFGEAPPAGVSWRRKKVLVHPKSEAAER